MILEVNRSDTPI